MAVTVGSYNHLLELMGDNTIDMDADTFTLALMNATHVFTAANTLWSEVSANEIASAFGYTTPGQNLTAVTWTTAVATVTFDAADVTWTAAGGSIGPATDAVLYDNTTTAPLDALMLSIDFGASETAGDGTDFKVTWNASGIISIA